MKMNETLLFAHWMSVYEYAEKHNARPSGLGADKVFCSNCECMVDKKTPYCPECGRTMLRWPAGWGGTDK